MFCRPALGGTDASKVALAFLTRHLRQRGFTLFDVQIRNHHTDQFGVIEIAAAEYARRLADALARPVAWSGFDPHWVQPAASCARSASVADGPARAESHNS